MVTPEDLLRIFIDLNDLDEDTEEPLPVVELLFAWHFGSEEPPFPPKLAPKGRSLTALEAKRSSTPSQAKLWELTPEQRADVLAPGIYVWCPDLFRAPPRGAKRAQQLHGGAQPHWQRALGPQRHGAPAPQPPAAPAQLLDAAAVRKSGGGAARGSLGGGQAQALQSVARRLKRPKALVTALGQPF